MRQIPNDSLTSDATECTQKVYPEASRVRSKRHLAYWEKAIFQRRANGNHWMILQHAGDRRKFSLGTPIKAAAAARARDIYLAVASGGWEEALRGPKPARTPVTVGQFLAELEAKADLKPETLRGYAIAFRAIIEEIFGIEGGKEKFDYRSGGHARWLARIHAIRLAEVTPAKVQEWKRTVIARAGDFG
jgi:hypothetical protein